MADSIQVPLEMIDNFTAQLDKFTQSVVRATNLLDSRVAKSSEKAKKSVVRTTNLLDSRVAKSSEKAKKKVSAFSSFFQAQLAAISVERIFGGIVNLAKKTIGQVAALQTEQVNVMKTTGLSREVMDKLTKSIVNFSNETGVARSKLMQLAESAGRMGIQSAKNIDAFAKTFAELETATDITSEMSEEVIRLFNTIGEDIGNVHKFGSAIAYLGDNAASGEARILGFAGRLSGLANYLHLNTSQLLGISTGLAETKNEAEMAGTAMQQLGAAMQKAYFGGAQIDMFTQVTGMTPSQFKKAFAEDANAVFIQFLEGVKKISKSGGNTSAIFKGIGLDGARASKAIIDLSNNVDRLKKHQQAAADEMQRDVKLTSEFGKRVGTTSQQIARLGEAWKNMLAKAMNSEELTETINNIADSLKNMDGEAIKSFGHIISLILKTAALIIKGLTGIEQAVEVVVNLCWNIVKTNVETIWTFIKAVIKDIILDIKTIKTAVNAVLKVTKASFVIAFDYIKQKVLKIINSILKAYNFVVKKFGKEGVELINLKKTDENISAAKKKIISGAKELSKAFNENFKGKKEIIKIASDEILQNTIKNITNIADKANRAKHVFKALAGINSDDNEENELPGTAGSASASAQDTTATKVNNFGNKIDTGAKKINDFAAAAAAAAQSLRDKVMQQLNEIRAAREAGLTKGGKKRLERVDRDIQSAKARGDWKSVRKYEQRRDRILGMDKFKKAGEEYLRKRGAGSIDEKGGLQSTENVDSVSGKSIDKKSRLQTTKIDDSIKAALNEQKKINKIIANGFKEMKELYTDLSSKVEAMA